MDLALAPSVHAVRRGADVVFLDIRRNSYLAISDPALSIRLNEKAALLNVADADVAEDLLAGGLAVPEGRPRLLGRGVAAASRTLEPAHELVATLRDLSDFALALAWAPSHVATRSLQPLVRFARRHPAQRDQNAVDLERRVAIFHRLLIWSPVQGDCLLRTHLLLRFLRSGGGDADWVFGVRTWPFAAHCWLQRGDLVLNDVADNLRAFTPILVA